MQEKKFKEVSKGKLLLQWLKTNDWLTVTWKRYVWRETLVCFICGTVPMVYGCVFIQAPTRNRKISLAYAHLVHAFFQDNFVEKFCLHDKMPCLFQECLESYNSKRPYFTTNATPIVIMTTENLYWAKILQAIERRACGEYRIVCARL